VEAAMSSMKSFLVMVMITLSSFMIGCESTTDVGVSGSDPSYSSNEAHSTVGKQGQIQSTYVRTIQQSKAIVITSGPQNGQSIGLATFEADLVVNPADLSGDTLLAGSSFSIAAVRYLSNGTPGPYTTPVAGFVHERIAIDKLEDGPFKK